MQLERRDWDEGTGVELISASLDAPALPGAKIISFPRTAEIAKLREKLAEQFPAAERRAHDFLPLGWAELDAAEGGLRRGAVTEMCSATAAGGLFLHAMLHTVAQARCFAGLVDAGNSFAPDEATPELLARWLIVRAPDPALAVKASDLLLRDGNLTLIVLDLQMADPRALKRVASATWHRFQRLAEHSAAALVVLTRAPLVEAAQVRITLQGAWTLAAQRRPRAELRAEIQPQIFLRRPVHSFFETQRTEALG